MRVKDKELEKINSSDIRRLERVLSSIDKYEKKFIDDFSDNIEKILGEITLPILKEVQKNSNIDKVETKDINIDGVLYKVPVNFLQVFHKSYISDPILAVKFEEKVKVWFKDKTDRIKNSIDDVNSYDDVEKALPISFALASLGLTFFHKKPNMVLRDVQKMTGIALSEGSIAELGTGEGKTLSAVLPSYLQALRGKGVHIITANGYLAKRDFEETLPIFEGLGLSSGFIPDNENELAEIEGKDPKKLSLLEKVDLEKKLKKQKQEAYKKDITYGSKQTFAFDYLRDNSILKKEDMIQREERPGFALIDEVDDVLIDDAEVPYRIASQTPVYYPNMTLRDLCIMQNIPYKEVLSKVGDLGLGEEITYEEARYISKVFGKKELIPDSQKYQELAQRFFNNLNILTTDDNMYGFKTGKEFFEALLDEDKYDSEEFRKNYDIIFCRELRNYKISDKCYENFLKYCYLSFQVNSVVLNYQDKIINDSTYVEGKDYIIKDTGKIKLTINGANRIIKDNNYPLFVDDYNQYMSNVSLDSVAMIHYFQQAIIANLLMKNGEDYVVDNGKVKTLKNGRIQEGSTYSNGLHQAIEIKEKIEVNNRTKETTAASTITQKDFYSRYDMFSGMTGTSSKEIFGEIFGKGTVELPKHAFYSFFGKRKKSDAQEPIGVDKKDTKFTLNREDKIGLIINSVLESRRTSPMQPVLLVVSNVDEIKFLESALINKGIYPQVLTAKTSKEDEALIIARAGLPGRVTISTEMAGRGTDIKIGGDRDTIIDIATERKIRKVEQQQGKQINFTVAEKEYLRKKLESSLVASPKIKLWTKEEEDNTREKMSTVGLKVISSGFFRMNRVDRQLEGRTGRNGISGVCERYACPDDLKRIGLTSFNMKDSIIDYFKTLKRNPDGLLDIDKSSYDMIMKKIDTIQKNNESIVKENIKYTQKLDGRATELVEQYRDQRRKVICDAIDINSLIDEMIVKATDAIIFSYVANKELSEKDMIDPINGKRIKIDIEAISLEVKQFLGITFDPNIVSKSNINLMELRDAIIRTARERHREISKDKDREALIVQNDYMISNIPDLLENSFTAKQLTSMAVGMEGQVDYATDMEFYRTWQKLTLEAYKQGTKCMMGIPLSSLEFEKLEAIRAKDYGNYIFKSEEKGVDFKVKDSDYKENNVSVIDRFKTVKNKVDKKNNKKVEKIEKKIAKSAKKDKTVEAGALYSKLEVRPLKFVSSMVNGKEITRLVLAKDRKFDMEKEETKKI